MGILPSLIPGACITAVLPSFAGLRCSYQVLVPGVLALEASQELGKVCCLGKCKIPSGLGEHVNSPAVPSMFSLSQI